MRSPRPTHQKVKIFSGQNKVVLELSKDHIMKVVPKLVRRGLWSKIQGMKSSLPVYDKGLQKMLSKGRESRFNGFEEAIQGFRKRSRKIALKFVTNLAQEINHNGILIQF
jgi:hypothetical protein